MLVSREFHYDSAHFLPLVPDGHKCGRMHGHTYRLKVILDGPVGDDGFVIDFADIDKAVKPLVDQLDHRLLNDVEGLENPTVEIQLQWIWERLDVLPLHELRLTEGLSNEAAYRGPIALSS